MYRMAPVVDWQFLKCITYMMSLFTVCKAGRGERKQPSSQDAFKSPENSREVVLCYHTELQSDL